MQDGESTKPADHEPEGEKGSWWSRTRFQLRDWWNGRPQVLAGNRLTTETLDLIKRAQKELVLATAYIQLWPDLEVRLREAMDRGVRVYCIVREPEERGRELAKTEDQLARLEKLCDKIYRVPRFHGKVYLNDDEAIVGSFNLVGGSQSSVEIGIHLLGSRISRKCYEELKRYCPDLGRQWFLGRRHKPRPLGFCIGCGGRRAFDTNRPFCRRCYATSDGGRALSMLNKRVCHRCGQPAHASLDAPLCRRCRRE